MYIARSFTAASVGAFVMRWIMRYAIDDAPFIVPKPPMLAELPDSPDGDEQRQTKSASQQDVGFHFIVLDVKGCLRGMWLICMRAANRRIVPALPFRRHEGVSRIGKLNFIQEFVLIFGMHRYLMRELLRVVRPGGVVLDCCMTAGTTSVAAYRQAAALWVSIEHRRQGLDGNIAKPEIYQRGARLFRVTL